MSTNHNEPNGMIKEAAVAYMTAVPARIPPTDDDLFHGDGKYVSEENYFKYFYEFGDVNYEWNDGILEAKPMADVAKARMYGWFLRLIISFLETNPIAGYTLLEIGFRLDIPNPKVRGAKKRVIRKPDIGIVLNDNPIPLHDEDRTYQGVCDLCIESLSDSTQKEIDRDVIEKKNEYSAGGVKEYFIVDETNNNMYFYRLNDLKKYVPLKPDAEGIIESTVLKGFRFRVSDLHRQPTMSEIVTDPLYRAYVLPEHYEAIRSKEDALEIAREERRKREEEQRRREDAERGRDMEKARADQFQALLREHGIDDL